MKFKFPLLLPVAAMAVALLPNTTQAESATQVLQYQSAFEGYRPFTTDDMKNWPEANRLVHEIGGWRVYAREGQDKDAGQSNAQHGVEPSPAPTNNPAEKPAAGHHTHGGKP